MWEVSRLWEPTNQSTQPNSTNQSTNQPINEPTNQRTNEPTNQRTNEPTNQRANKRTEVSEAWAVCRFPRSASRALRCSGQRLWRSWPSRRGNARVPRSTWPGAEVGMGQNETTKKTRFRPIFLLPGFHLGCTFLTHSQVKAPAWSS